MDCNLSSNYLRVHWNKGSNDSHFINGWQNVFYMESAIIGVGIRVNIVVQKIPMRMGSPSTQKPAWKYWDSFKTISSKEYGFI